MHKHRGNIVLMVLLIMVSASAFALLIMQYTRSMYANNRMTHDYNQAYYLAKAGIEIGLADSLNGGDNHSYAIGYENGLTDSGNANTPLLCPSGSSCMMDSTITALDTYHTNTHTNQISCTPQNAFTLKQSESLAFPLFIIQKNRTIQNRNLHPGTSFTIQGASGPAPKLSIGATVKNNNGYSVAGPTTPHTSFTLSDLSIGEKSPSGKDGEYIVLINKNNDDVTFCLKSSIKIPRQRIRIDSTGEFNNYSISLSASKKTTLPSFLFNTSIGRSGS